MKREILWAKKSQHNGRFQKEMPSKNLNFCKRFKILIRIKICSTKMFSLPLPLENFRKSSKFCIVFIFKVSMMKKTLSENYQRWMMCENGRRRNDVVGIFCTHTKKMKERSKQVNFGDLAEEMTLNKSILYFSYKSFELVMIMN